MAPASQLLYAFAAALVCNTVYAAPTTSSAASASPSSTDNPNGPYSNPYDSTSPPVTWPGSPTASTATPTSRPGPAFHYGGLPQFSKLYSGIYWLPTSAATPTVKGTAASPSLSINGLGNKYSGVAKRPTHTVTAGETPTSGPCATAPNTGVTRTYNFDVGYATISPDGVKKNGLVINGAFPGPRIEANWGDWVKIVVTNSLPNEGTALHWHGLLQTETPWFDGVPSVSQCPIPPNGTYTYLWRADMYGTSWYHSHYSGQYAGGALGPIVIHGPKTAAYDVDLGPIILSDWYHQDYFTLVNNTMNFIIPQSQNNLINGKMNYPCQNTTLPCTPNAGVSKFKFSYSTKYRLRLINTSAEGVQKFSIDNHTLTVIANDFVPVVPYTTNVVTLGVGQRTDVIVQSKSLSQILRTTNAYNMRADLGTCSFTDGTSPIGLAGVYYPFADTNKVPKSKSDVTPAQINSCQNDDLNLTQAWCPSKPDPNPPTTETVEIVFGNNGTNFVWFMNGESFRGDYNHPVNLAVAGGNSTFEPEWNVFNMGTNSSIRMIIKNTFPFGSHPMHLHGHNFHVLAEGVGDWDGTITNPGNTQMRDVQLVPPAANFNPVDFSSTPTYIVLQWQNDNPSVWPLHCHIAWHVSAGLYINVMERPADIAKLNVPASSGELCHAWGEFTNTTIIDQIDSGL